MRDRLETALSVLLTVAGLAIAGAVVTRELSGNRVPSAEPEEIKNWEQLRETGIRTGDAASPSWRAGSRSIRRENSPSYSDAGDATGLALPDD